MDDLFLNTIAFPVRRGGLFRGRKSLGDYCWELEVYCDESPQFADQEAPDDLLAGAAPLLSAQSLPLRVQSPDELIGREYLFPPTPKPDPPDWDTPSAGRSSSGTCGRGAQPNNCGWPSLASGTGSIESGSRAAT